MENLDWVHQKSSNSQSRRFPGRQAIQARPDHPNRVVSPSGGLTNNMQPVAPASNRSICHQVQQFASVSPVPDPLAIAVDALSLPWEYLDTYAFPPEAILGKVLEKLQDSPCKRIILIAPGRPNRPWFWDLMAMSSQIPLSLPNLPNLLAQPSIRSSQKSDKPESSYMAPRATAIKNRDSPRQGQQGLRLHKEDQSHQSVRQSGASLIRWTSGHPL